MFRITEHRLSVGLLVTLLLVASGYGVWMLISPFLPDSIVGYKKATRVEVGNVHFKNGEWPDLVVVCQQMLEDDPENGFALRKMAYGLDRQLKNVWEKLENVESATGNARAGEKLRVDEDRLFELTINTWRELLDHARYRSRAYEGVASLHSLRFSKFGDKAEKEAAFDVLEHMVENQYATGRGIYTITDLIPLQEDERFRSLANKEYRISNGNR